MPTSLALNPAMSRMACSIGSPKSIDATGQGIPAAHGPARDKVLDDVALERPGPAAVGPLAGADLIAAGGISCAVGVSGREPVELGGHRSHGFGIAVLARAGLGRAHDAGWQVPKPTTVFMPVAVLPPGSRAGVPLHLEVGLRSP